MTSNQIVTPQDDITGPDYEIMDRQIEEIEETIECLLRRAVELGSVHSEIMFQENWKAYSS